MASLKRIIAFQRSKLNYRTYQGKNSPKWDCYDGQSVQ